MNKNGLRTDLALESAAITAGKETGVPGVSVHEQQEGDVTVTTVQIDKEGEAQMGRRSGTYVTIESKMIRDGGMKEYAQASSVLAREVRRFLQQANVPDDGKCLVAGLGNRQVTPDSLGPRTIERLIVTNHLFTLHPEYVQTGYRPVSAMAPGVMGMTGMETGDVLLSIVAQEQPAALIVIDSLASRSIERLNATIQLTDTGIHPGAGIGNRRKEISRETAGVPVIAIGIPTVIDAATLAHNSMEKVTAHLEEKTNQSGTAWKETLLGKVGLLSDEEKHELIQSVLTPAGENMIVTPKEADLFLHRASAMIASALNEALHQRPPEETRSFFAG